MADEEDDAIDIRESKEKVALTAEEKEAEEARDIERRRELRKHYRELRDVLDVKSRELSTIGDEEFIILHDRTSQLFKAVNCTRELAIDAETLNDFSRGVKSQATKLSDVSSFFSFDHLVEGLRNQYKEEGSNQFSWSKLGHDCGGIFAAIPYYRLEVITFKIIFLL